ncbi:MAG: glucosamine--fructose-6-phosphate aminotransferase [Chromatiaceae bacterium]
MLRLPLTLAAWGGDAFAATLKAELGALAPAELHLHRLASTGHALDTRVSVTLLESRETADVIEARLGVFFEEILPGCSCGDEPEPQPGFGELMLQIDKATARAELAPIVGAAP